MYTLRIKSVRSSQTIFSHETRIERKIEYDGYERKIRNAFTGSTERCGESKGAERNIRVKKIGSD
ncbi:hypothetical protein [Drancourtella sp. An12]|uniref:hypothetical protein n=1 Tax=Drancourtella sp. An12 TaxID=1965548 RepID=UPI0031BABD12